MAETWKQAGKETTVLSLDEWRALANQPTGGRVCPRCHGRLFVNGQCHHCARSGAPVTDPMPELLRRAAKIRRHRG
jgi:hypothetical protein